VKTRFQSLQRQIQLVPLQRGAHRRRGRRRGRRLARVLRARPRRWVRARGGGAVHVESS
jgi:hypothetical protein